MGSLKKGIALFGGNFVLPFEHETNLSNCLSYQYLSFCQKYNENNPLQQLQTINRENDNKTKYFSGQSNATSNHLLSGLPSTKMEYLVLAPCKQSSKLNSPGQEFYDIATIVNLETCPESGTIKAISKGADSLVKIKKSTENKKEGGQMRSFEENYSELNRLVVENEPFNQSTFSKIKPSELPFVVIQKRKMFFCDYESLYSSQPQYSREEKKFFVHYIHDLAHRTHFDSLELKAHLEQLASDKRNSLFPRIQLLELLQHLDHKYFFNMPSSSWTEQKYEILKTQNDKHLLDLLLQVSNQLSL